jgi:Integrase core domain
LNIRKPTQDTYIESFHGKFRDACLNEHWFETMAQARNEIARWRVDFNALRPHSSCGRVAPARFASLHRQQAADAAQPRKTQEQSPSTPRRCSKPLVRELGAGLSTRRLWKSRHLKDGLRGKDTLPSWPPRGAEAGEITPASGFFGTTACGAGSTV